MAISPVESSSSSVEMHEKKGDVQTTHVAVPGNDPEAAPSTQVSSRAQHFSNLFTIFCAGFALISDGYQNHLMTIGNVIFKTECELASGRRE